MEKLVVVVSTLSSMSLEPSSGQVGKFESEASRDVGDRLDDGESTDRFHHIQERPLTGVSAMYQRCS